MVSQSQNIFNLVYRKMKLLRKGKAKSLRNKISRLQAVEKGTVARKKEENAVNEKYEI